MTRPHDSVPFEAFRKMGPVDQQQMQEELWTMWQRVVSERFESQGPPRMSCERDLMLQLADALRLANGLSKILEQMRLEDQARVTRASYTSEGDYF